MSLVPKIIIWLLLIWSSYHLIRDLLQDALGLHHPLIDILHMKPRNQLHILGQFYKFWGIPFELGVFILSVKSITSNNFGLFGALAVLLFLLFVAFWAWSSF